MASVLTLRGRVSAPPGADVAVASQVAGRVVTLGVHEGDHVESGATIATIDDAPSRDALHQADAAVAQAQANAANADATLERTRQLVARGIAAKQELDDAVSRADQAHAAVTSASAAADQARRTLGRVLVRSAFPGVVTRVWRGRGALVDGTAQTPIVQLAATDTQELDADATEEDLATLALGQQVRVTFVRGGALEGVVQGRPAALDPATGLGLARIALLHPSPPRLLGEFGTAVISVAARENVLTVPLDAIRGAAPGGATIVVCRADSAEVRDVAIGGRDERGVEVTKGLADGEWVALDHVLGLDTGSPITRVAGDAGSP